MTTMRTARLGKWTGSLLALGVSVTTLAQVAAPVPIAGRYRSSFGDVILSETGGTYDAQSARIVIDRIEGNVVEGTWSQDDAAERCADGRYRGRFRFTFTAAGFTGVYSRCEGPLTREWNGTRTATAAVTAPRPPAPAPVARPRLPVNTPEFQPLKRVAPIEQGWDRNLYEEFSARVTRMARWREDGECALYNRSLRDFETDIREYPRRSLERFEIDSDSRAHYARIDVINHFRYAWLDTLRVYGCTPPTAASSSAPAPSPEALAPLGPVPEMQSDFHPNTYESFRDMATELATLRTAGQCADYWRRLWLFEESLASSREVAMRQDPGPWSRTGPHDYFDSWVRQARRRGCGETAREP